MLNNTKEVRNLAGDLFFSPVFLTYASCFGAPHSLSPHHLLLILIYLVFSLASRISGVLSRMLCLFAVPCTCFVLFSLS